MYYFLQLVEKFASCKGITGSMERAREDHDIDLAYVVSVFLLLVVQSLKVRLYFQGHDRGRIIC